MSTVEFIIPVISGSEYLLVPDVWASLTLAFVVFQISFTNVANLSRFVKWTPKASDTSLFINSSEPSTDASHLTQGMQFERMVAIAKTACDHTSAAARYQQAASEKLDACDYTMQIMLKDLSVVMPHLAIASRSIQTDNICHRQPDRLIGQDRAQDRVIAKAA